MHISFLPKITCPNSQDYGANLETQLIFFKFTSKFFSGCQSFQLVRDSFKSFTNMLKAYGLDQQRLSQIKIENCKSETQIILTNQQEQGGHLRITKKQNHKR
jgi:hypothetical protein